MAPNRTYHIALIFLATMLLSGLHGCKSSKDASIKPLASSRTSADIVTQASPADRINSLFDSYKSWQDVAMPVKCRLTSPKSMSISGRASMIRGKEISISLRMLGIEVAGLYADTDSFFVFEKLNRTMLAEPLTRITASSGLTLADIQDLLLGRICYPGQDKLDSSSAELFSIVETNGSLQLTPRKNTSTNVSWGYFVSDEIVPYLISATMNIGGKIEAKCNYASALQTPAGPASPSAALTATTGKQKLEATLYWSLDRAAWDKGMIAENRTPKGYRRISFESLIKLLSAF